MTALHKVDWSGRLARLRARRDPDGIEVSKEFASPSSATSGVASYSLEGQRLPRRMRLKNMRRGVVGIPVALGKGTSQDGPAHAAATSPYNLRNAPTENQAKAGNYKKGKIRIAGMDISVENPAGSKRRPEWPPLQSHYGYIRRSLGADGDHVDVFVKIGTPDDYAGPVWVVDQYNGGWWDEHKVLIGWYTESDARRAYQANYAPDWNGLGAITQLSVPAFKDWLKTGDTTKPIAPKGGKLRARAA